MISKKHMILGKAKVEFEKRIENGENIAFNFAYNNVDNGTSSVETTEETTTTTIVNKRRRTSRETAKRITELSFNEDSDDREYEPVVHKPVKSTRGRRPATSKNGIPQESCCVIGCDNAVTNRLRFSLRCLTDSDFKPDFLEQGWNKVCHYHYFSDLYKHKKMLKQQQSGETATNTTAVKVAPRRRSKSNPSPPMPLEQLQTRPTTITITTTRNTTAAAVPNQLSLKRSRDDFEAQVLKPIIVHAPAVHHIPVIHKLNQPDGQQQQSQQQQQQLPSVHTLIESLQKVPPANNIFQRCSTVFATTPVKKKDASAFFSFVEQNHQRVTM